MKALIVNGSPRIKGNSAALAGVTAAVLEKSGVETRTLTLQRMDIRACTACEKCKKTNEVVCAHDDDMTSIFPDILETDIILMAGPNLLVHRVGPD